MHQIGTLRLPRIFLGWFAFAFCVFALDGCAGQVAKIPHHYRRRPVRARCSWWVWILITSSLEP